MVHHPSLQSRRIVLVGTYDEARDWANAAHIDVDHIFIAESARQLIGVDPTTLHVVVLPSACDWRNPHFFVLRTELNYLHAKGATLEWA